MLLPETPELLAVLSWGSRALRPREKRGSPAPSKQSICRPSASPVSGQLHCLARVTQIG